MLKRLLVLLLAITFLAPLAADAGTPKSGGTLKFALLRCCQDLHAPAQFDSVDK